MSKGKAQTADDQKEKRRRDWEEYQAVISEAYLRLIGQYKRMPKLRELEAETGITILTIRKHLAELDFKVMSQPMRVLTPQVMLGLAKSAINGDPQAVKLWLQVQEHFKEGSLLEHTGKDGRPIAVDLFDGALAKVYGKGKK